MYDSEAYVHQYRSYRTRRMAYHPILKIEFCFSNVTTHLITFKIIDIAPYWSAQVTRPNQWPSFNFFFFNQAEAESIYNKSRKFQSNFRWRLIENYAWKQICSGCTRSSGYIVYAYTVHTHNVKDVNRSRRRLRVLPNYIEVKNKGDFGSLLLPIFVDG